MALPMAFELNQAGLEAQEPDQPAIMAENGSHILHHRRAAGQVPVRTHALALLHRIQDDRCIPVDPSAPDEIVGVQG